MPFLWFDFLSVAPGILMNKVWIGCLSVSDELVWNVAVPLKKKKKQQKMVKKALFMSARVNAGLM